MKILRIGLLVGVLLLISSTLVSAQGPHHFGPAEHLYAPDCWIMDMDWNWYYIPDCSPTRSLITNSKPGILHWNAHAQLPEGATLPEKTAHITYEDTGFACWWDEGVVTTNYTLTITKTGKWMISCHFRPDKWQPEP
jgi:hypothetical protein